MWGRGECLEPYTMTYYHITGSKKCTVVLLGIVSPEGKKNSCTSQSLCWVCASDSFSYYISSNPISEGFCKWGNWGIKKLNHRTNVAQLRSIRAGTQIPAWSQHFHFLLYYSVHCLWVETEQPSKRACVHMHVSRSLPGKGELPSGRCCLIS